MTAEPIAADTPKGPEPVASPETTSVEPWGAGPTLGVCVLNWVLPGAGYLAAGDWRRGLALGALINSVFLAGMAFSGYVLVPAFSPSDPTFNIFAVLTFIVQLFHGAGCLGYLALSQALPPATAAAILGHPGAAYADLGAFHMAVAGGLNYFACVRLWDFLRGEATDEPAGSASPAQGAGEEQP